MAMERPPVTRLSLNQRGPVSTLCFAALALMSGWAGPSASAQQSNSVVAVVNADPITRDQLSQATLDRYGKDVLDNMVNRYLILQQCKQQGIEITNEDVRTEIARIAKKFGLDVPLYLQLLQEERDISPDQYSREIIWPILALRELVRDQVEVSEDEFNRAYLAQFGEAVKCRMIMTDRKALADQIQAQATTAPGTFAALAREHSNDETSASIGGLIPPIRRYMGDSRIEEAVFSLQPNQVSSVVQIADQYMVFQAVKRLPATQPRPQDVPAIKDQIQDRIRDGKMQNAANALFAGLQKRANVVKVLGDEATSKQYPGVAAIINGQQISIAAVSAECVKRHGKTVLEGEINRRLLAQALKSAKKTVTQSDIEAEITRAAISYGFVRSDGTADREAWMESVLSDGATTEMIYIHDAVWPSVALKKLVEDSITLTQEDLQMGFESAYGPRVEVLACVLSDQRTAQKVWELARDNPTDAFFAQLAEQYSVEPSSASNSGKVPPIRKHGGQPAIEKEAFALKPGGQSGIIATGDQYIIMRCQGFTEPLVTDFNAVRSELERDLLNKKTTLAMGVKFDELKDSSEIDNFLAIADATPDVAGRAPATR